MQMMYGVVARELKKSGHHNLHPEDFLNFYCLGKREEISKDTSSDANETAVTFLPNFVYSPSLKLCEGAPYYIIVRFQLLNCW